jgi:glycosyltransferase involved in cell wall biosynthesis
MRILHFGKYWAKDGGIETHVKALCKGLASAGINVVNLVSSVTRKGSRFTHDGYTVVESPSLGIVASTSIAPKMLADARSLQAEQPFDLIHLHFPDPMSHLASMVLPSHIPRVLTWHSDIVKQRYLLKMYRPFQRRTIEESSAIIAATPSHFTSSNQVPSHYPVSQRQVIPLGFEFDWLAPTPIVIEKANAIRQLAQERFIVFALGRHVPYKGFDVLIDAIHDTDAFLVLGGEGPLTKALRSQVERQGLSDRIYFTGRISGIDVAANYHACDAFCLPSVTKNEAFGIVQIEAMACGKPVICTQLHNGVNDINPNGVTGLTVPVQDPVSLANAIVKLATDPHLCRRLGAQGKKRAFEEFTAGPMVQRHLTLYRELTRP